MAESEDPPYKTDERNLIIAEYRHKLLILTGDVTQAGRNQDDVILANFLAGKVIAMESV